jgi:prefoldin subunit 5
MDINKVSRIMGGIWIGTSLLWALLAVFGLFFGFRFLERLQTDLEDNLDLVVESLDPVHALILQATDIVSSTHQSIGTVQSSVHNTSAALADLRPLLWKTTKVVTIDVPVALDGVQDSMPSLIATAKSVDETLTWLSGIGFTIPIPFGQDMSFDLGIDYAPEVPLDQAMENMSGNLEGLPDDLRDMKESLNTADANLVIVSDDLALLAGDLETMNQDIANLNPQLEGLANSIESIQDGFRELQNKIPESIKTARRVMLIIAGLLVVSQVPSMYLGWILASGIFPPPNSVPESSKKTGSET